MKFRKFAFLCLAVFQFFRLAGQTGDLKKPAFFNGIRHVVYTQYHAGKSDWDGYVVGSGIQYNALLPVTKFLAVGAGGGIESFNLERGETVLPMYAVTDFSWQQKRTFPYLRFAAGWGFATKLLNADLETAKGGLRLEPSFGMRFGTKSNISFFGGLSYLYQKATFGTTSIWGVWGEPPFVRIYNYKRISLLIGVQF
jgi:hypothetical protein